MRTMADSEAPVHDPIEEGLRLFNEGYFFEAHEVLEDVWHRERGEPRLFLQGLIQVCAGFHHYQSGNLRGAMALLARGIEKIRRYPERYLGFDTRRLVSDLEDARRRIERVQGTPGAATLEFPLLRRMAGP